MFWQQSNTHFGICTDFILAVFAGKFHLWQSCACVIKTHIIYQWSNCPCEYRFLYYEHVFLFLSSGVFGAFLCLSKVRLKTRPKVLLHIDLIYCLAKVFHEVLFHVSLSKKNLNKTQLLMWLILIWLNMQYRDNLDDRYFHLYILDINCCYFVVGVWNCAHPRQFILVSMNTELLKKSYF